jgi:hypothetical protein
MRSSGSERVRKLELPLAVYVPSMLLLTPLTALSLL